VVGLVRVNVEVTEPGTTVAGGQVVTVVMN